jgi:periplasmic mercuric ion binding protein
MKRILAAGAFAAMALCGGEAFAGEQTVTLSVEKMYCAACPYIVKQSLAKVPGVENVIVSFEKKTATVTYDDQKTTLAKLTDATLQAGYPSALAP